MLPPDTRRSGAGAQRVPVSAPISRAMAAKRSISRRAAHSEGGQVRQPLALAAQERSEAESVVQVRERRHVGQAAPEPGRRGLDRKIELRRASGRERVWMSEVVES